MDMSTMSDVKSGLTGSHHTRTKGEVATRWSSDAFLVVQHSNYYNKDSVPHGCGQEFLGTRNRGNVSSVPSPEAKPWA